MMGRVGSKCEELRTRAERERQRERLLLSLRELLSLGSERLEREPGLELRSTAELQSSLDTHTVRKRKSQIIATDRKSTRLNSSHL